MLLQIQGIKTLFNKNLIHQKEHFSLYIKGGSGQRRSAPSCRYDHFYRYWLQFQRRNRIICDSVRQELLHRQSMEIFSQIGQNRHTVQFTLSLTWSAIFFYILSSVDYNLKVHILPIFLTGSCEGIAVIENLMEHVAKVLNEDPLEFRLKNMNPKSEEVGSLKKTINQLILSSDYEQRVRQVFLKILNPMDISPGLNFG